MLQILLLSGSLLLAQTAPAPSEELAREVTRLLRELAAPELARRDAAQQKLVELGPAVLDLLPEPTPRTSAEEKQRLGQVRDKLQRAQAEASVRTSYITLQGEMPLSAAFAEIEKQTGNLMQDSREARGQEASDPKIKLALDKVPFWQAMDNVLDLAGLTVDPYPEKDGLGVVSLGEGEAPRMKRPTSYSGAYRVEATEMNSRRGYRLPADRRMQLLLEISWEPRLDPISILQPMSDIAALDNEGRQIEIEGTDGTQEIEITPGNLAAELSIPMLLPDRKVKSIASLKGKFLALVPGRVETFRFNDLTKKNVEMRKAGVVVELEQVRKNVDVWEVRVLVRFDKTSGALETHRGWIFNNEAYLETPDKKRLDADGFETTRQTENEVGVAYIFDLPKGPAGMTLVYKTPSIITMLPIEYEIKDLELP